MIGSYRVGGGGYSFWGAGPGVSDEIWSQEAGRGGGTYDYNDDDTDMTTLAAPVFSLARPTSQLSYFCNHRTRNAVLKRNSVPNPLTS